MTSISLTDTLVAVECAELLFAKTSKSLTQYYQPVFSCEDMFSPTLSERRVSGLNVSDDTKNP